MAEPIPAPYARFETEVAPEWIDYNGHLNIGYYLLPFELAARSFFAWVDLSRAYKERANHALFAAECHVSFEREVREGARLRFETQLLALKPKVLDVMHFMYQADEGYLAATNEVVYLHVDLAKRRTVPIPNPQHALLQRIWETHRALPRPAQAGRSIEVS